MALDNLVDGMTGLQMANTIKNNFDKVLDAESAENKAENAGLSIKTDYDATRYIDLQLADGTPVKMKMDVFCQAIAPVVAEQITSSNKKAYTLSAGVEVETNITKSGLYRWDFRDDNSTRPLYFIFDYSLIVKLNDSWFGSKITLRADSGKLFIKYTNAGNVILTFLG